ncbi:AmiR/NasT family two-component response regulator [Palleronia aestuarii]|uniref:AmiR/NasT family two-component response regulator n=1 Tax=Palleronia aestuarii TaxID=568105 RepID=A0A2W7MSQ6_9RHOB|nr:ANTAR domain-containing protein [Palleronia aestuarii]PZX10583.1 AmiR/NasT family two-component response regulator [Palleronia aestuarii]
MKNVVLKNFRNWTALIVQDDTPGRDSLARTLVNLGLVVRFALPRVTEAGEFTGVDIAFIDLDEAEGAVFDAAAAAGIPMIALVGSETPSRLGKAVRARITSHIQKPVRSSGVFTALFLAANENMRRAEITKEEATLKRRLAGRRTLVRAILTLMTRWGIDDQEAYGRLRRDAMEKRLTIEDVARAVLEPAEDEADPIDRLPDGTGGITKGPVRGLSIRGDQE